MQTVKEGKHPERTIYRPTKMGRDEFFDWLKFLLRTPTKEYSQFAAGLSFLGHLSPKEACDLLKERRVALTERIDRTRTSMHHTLQMGVHRVFVIETDYELTLLEEEMKWLDRLIREIEDGTLTKRADEQWNWKV